MLDSVTKYQMKLGLKSVSPNLVLKGLRFQKNGVINSERQGRRRSPPSEETRRKLSLANKWEKRSSETLRKISVAKTGSTHAPHSEKTKEKMREAAKMRPPFTKDQKLKISKTVKEIFKDKTKHPRWKGGISFEPYCIKFNNEFKERVREFFGRKCVECGAPENGKKLCVHHVNFKKDTCCTPEVPRLFVALCTSCHGKQMGIVPFGRITLLR